MRALLIAAPIVGLSLGALPAMAGEGAFERSDGFELTIKCKNSGCTVRGKEPGGRWGNVEKGPGGSENYQKLKAKYEGMGFELK